MNAYSINRWLALALALTTMPAMARDRSKPAGPTGNPGSWFTDKDYPPDAKRANQQGRVSVRITIDADGRVTACEITGSSGSSSIDAKTCELVRTRGTFVPARDARGKPTASSYSLSTRWVLDDGPLPELVGPWRLAAVIGIDSAGKNVSCREERSGPAPVEMQMCAMAAKMPPAYGLYARGSAANTKVVEIVMETSFDLDGATPRPTTYGSSGRETLTLHQVHFDIGVDGKAQNCRVIAQSGPDAASLCSEPIGPFAPLAKPQGITVTTAASRPVNK